MYFECSSSFVSSRVCLSTTTMFDAPLLHGRDDTTIILYRKCCDQVPLLLGLARVGTPLLLSMF
jgi:hypothetical protein